MTLKQLVLEASQRLVDAFLAVIPALLVLAASLLVGILIGFAVRGLLLLLFRLLNLGTEKGRASQLLRAAGITAAPSRVAAAVSFWAAVCTALAIGVNALTPGVLRDILAEAVSFLPRLFGSALLLVLGLGLAALARRSVLLAAVNAGFPWARSAARFIHLVVVAVFAAAALDQLGVGRTIVVVAFSILGGGLALALALAFGIGGRDMARRYLEKRMRAEEDDTGIRHI